MTANLYFAWAWFLAGILAGAIQGLHFHKEHWLGGYNAWPRRITRLGHISFFGTGLLNLTAALTALTLALPASTPLSIASPALITGAAAMPTVCYLSAWKKPLRNLFFIPVLALATGTAAFLTALLLHAPPEP